MRPGDEFEVVIEKGVYRGLGLARIDGRALFVTRGLPGDRLHVRVTSVERGFARAVPEAVLAPGPGRRDAPCVYAAQCGGCAYQELDYEAQLALKVAILRESLARGHAAWEGPIGVSASPREGWRTRATFHVAATGSNVRVGLRQEGSHRTLDLPRCLQISEAMNATVDGMRQALARQPALAARIQDLRLIEGRVPGRVIATLSGDLHAADTASVLRLQDGTPLAGLGVAFGESAPSTRLVGLEAVTSEVGGLRFRVGADSFFQANRFLVEGLAERVQACLPGSGPLLDLYAGVGLFALTLAQGAANVVGIEGNPSGVADAVANAEAAGFSHVRFLEGDVRQALPLLPKHRGERIVLDPPRAGAGPDVVRAVAARDPEAVAYVSCDPSTLARDLAVFREAGYDLAALDLFDLFPDTFHLEAVALLRRVADL